MAVLVEFSGGVTIYRTDEHLTAQETSGRVTSIRITDEELLALADAIYARAESRERETT